MAVEQYLSSRLGATKWIALPTNRVVIVQPVDTGLGGGSLAADPINRNDGVANQTQLFMIFADVPCRIRQRKATATFDAYVTGGGQSPFTGLNVLITDFNQQNTGANGPRFWQAANTFASITAGLQLPQPTFGGGANPAFEVTSYSDYGVPLAASAYLPLLIESRLDDWLMITPATAAGAVNTSTGNLFISAVSTLSSAAGRQVV